MQRYRFDDKRVLIEAIVELLNRGVEPDELDLVLSRIGPVDLDLMRQCLIEVWEYNQQEPTHEPMAA
ncbi:hypothetical protein [Brucella rhizosphaerae]|uniref:hypothetical protein n=1 Tax=Brucella rhizosphaerae TaxID=571254 RepID=UPI000B98547D|nr:hypothetical protein [Brucella rhizosphaerae]